MADDVDRANELVEKNLQMILGSLQKITLVPTGLCKNCDIKVKPKAIFCSAECREDFDWYSSRKTLNTRGLR